MRHAGGQVVILGKRGHAEVIGLTGQVADPTIVIERVADWSQIDFTRPIYFLSQTTQSISLFERWGPKCAAGPPMRTCISTTRSAGRSPAANSTCRSSARFDAVVFVCGRKSSNGRVLSEVCRTANPRPAHRGSFGNRPRMVRRRRDGGDMRRHVDAQMADAGCCRRSAIGKGKMRTESPRQSKKGKSKIQTTPTAAPAMQR